MRASVARGLLASLALSGCEIFANFDRDKIAPPTPVTPTLRTDAAVIEPEAGSSLVEGGKDAASPSEAGATLADAGATDAGAFVDAAIDGGVMQTKTRATAAR